MWTAIEGSSHPVEAAGRVAARLGRAVVARRSGGSRVSCPGAQHHERFGSRDLPGASQTVDDLLKMLDVAHAYMNQGVGVAGDGEHGHDSADR